MFDRTMLTLGAFKLEAVVLAAVPVNDHDRLGGIYGSVDPVAVDAAENLELRVARIGARQQGGIRGGDGHPPHPSD